MAKIVGRMVTRKVEAKHVEELREIKLVWVVDESNTRDKVSPSQRAAELSQ